MIVLPSPTPTPDVRAEEIFAKARAALAARAFPPTIKYAVRISGLSNGKWTGRTYDSFEDWPDGTVFSRSISEEEAANPVKPPPFCFFGLGAPKKAGLELPDLIGFPELAVTYTFGLAPPPAADPEPSSTSIPTGLKTIGTVEAVSRTYDVRLAGEEPVDGNACWHLTLRPLGNPGKYRLRDLWVDESSNQVRRLVTDGNFTRPGLGSSAWTVSYVQLGNSWYLSSEISSGPVSGPATRYDKVDVQFLNVTADPGENLDFGIAGSTQDVPLVEPSDER
jgi:hypothetical protein